MSIDQSLESSSEPVVSTSHQPLQVSIAGTCCVPAITDVQICTSQQSSLSGMYLCIFYIIFYDCCSSLGLKKHQDAMCRLADPVTLAVNLHSKDLISDSTKDRALQVIGIENYQKNAEMLNEVEKVIKSDSTKLPILCQVLHTMPLMKQYGEMILKEAGLSAHLTLPSTSTAPSE